MTGFNCKVSTSFHVSNNSFGEDRKQKGRSKANIVGVKSVRVGRRNFTIGQGLSGWSEGKRSGRGKQQAKKSHERRRYVLSNYVGQIGSAVYLAARTAWPKFPKYPPRWLLKAEQLHEAKLLLLLTRSEASMDPLECLGDRAATVADFALNHPPPPSMLLLCTQVLFPERTGPFTSIISLASALL
jgi:hypothetical protein